MAMIARSRKLLSIVLKNKRNGCLYSSVTACLHRSSAINLYFQLHHLFSSEAEGGAEHPWNFLKYALVAALTGGAATAGYATYAYTSEEIDEKTQALRASAKVSAGDDASSFDKLRASLKSAAMTVPAKLVELYLDLRASTEEQVRGFTEPSAEKLLPDLHPQEQHVFTLLLDLNETLLYSGWKRERGWRTFKRPGVDDFLEHLAQFYEIIVYSDQQPMDLSKLNRDPSRILYVIGNALESCLQQENCVPI